MANDKLLGLIIIGFVAVIIGLALLQESAGDVNTLTATRQSNNASFTLPANGSTIDLTPCGQLNTSAIVIFNETNGTTGFQNHIIPSSNYTISQAAGTDGFLSTKIRLTNLYNGGGYYGHKSNVTCTYEPYGYIHGDSASRSVAGLIIVFFVLAIAFSVIPDLRDWLKVKIGYS